MRYLRKYLLFFGLILTLLPPVKTFSAEPAALLDIPFDRQDKALSCEVATLKMALRYKGVDPLTEDQLMALVGYSEPIRRSRGIWGDPNVGFVGNIRGRQNTTGYGVHWDPIAEAAQVFLPESHTFQGFSPAQIAAEISAGNPVIIWGLYGKSWPDTWRTPEGKVIRAWRGEHTRVIIGFTGEVNNPDGFILIDPLLPRRLTWSTDQLLKNSAPFGTAGVIVK